MSREIPQNEIRSETFTVSESGLFPLFEKLHDIRNVLTIEHERAGTNFKVTVHYAIMDLEFKLAVLSTAIGEAVTEANDIAHVRS